MKHLEKMVALGFVALGAACGDDDGGGGGGSTQFDSSLPESEPLSQITPAQITEACNSLQSTVNSLFTEQRMCEFLAAFLSENAATCRDFAADCVAQPSMGSDMAGIAEGADLGCGDASSFASCQVTVGEFETCLSDSLTAFDQILEGLTCANAGNVDPEMLSSLDQSPQSCARLESDCPEIFAADAAPQ